MKDVEIQKRVLERILNATDSEVNDYEWMKNCIMEYGIYPYNNSKALFPNARYTRNGILQIPSEFASFCSYISNFYIENAIEIGVYRGRSSYIICALFFRKNKNLKYYMVDIIDNLDYFEVFSSILPCVKIIPATSEDFKGQNFDFVFIDADHSYDASVKDYINVGQYANKLVCFHDIFGHEYDYLNGGIVRTWKEVSALSKQYTKLTFSQFENLWMGIGLAIKNQMNPVPFEDFGYILEAAHRKMNEFNDFLLTDKKLYLYGSGCYAQIFYSLAQKSNKQVSAFVIPEEQTRQISDIDGVPIYYIDEIQEAYDKCRFILALPECLHKVALDSLNNKGFYDVCFCSDRLFDYLLGTNQKLSLV